MGPTIKSKIWQALIEVLEYSKTKELTEKVSASIKSTWAASVAVTADFSTAASQTDWFRSLNENFSSTVSKAMDSAYKIGSIDSDSGLKMAAVNHRILDEGHTISESFSRAMHAGEEGGLGGAESFLAWAKAYVTDLSSPAGMPIPFAEELYSLLQKLEISEQAARDVVTVNGQEAVQALLGGTIAAVALLLSWKDADKERFSHTIGSLGVSSLLALNPAVLVIAIVGLALGYQKEVIKPEAIKRGGLVNVIGIGVSALIPGPVLFGAIPAFVIATYVSRKLGRDVPVNDQFKAWLVYLQSEKFSSASRDKLAVTTDWMEQRFSELKKVA